MITLEQLEAEYDQVKAMELTDPDKALEKYLGLQSLVNKIIIRLLNNVNTDDLTDQEKMILSLDPSKTKTKN